MFSCCCRSSRHSWVSTNARASRSNTSSASHIDLHAKEPASTLDNLIHISMADENNGILEKLNKDTIVHILNFLDTSNDVAHASSVCHSWRKYVLELNLWKKLCIKFFPEIGTDFKCSSVNKDSEELSLENKNTGGHTEAGTLVYQLFLRRLQGPPLQRTCICEPLHASSTDNLPLESVAQTLFPEPVYPDEETPSYWSSKGQSNTNVPETLTYRLVSDVCVVHNVKVQPFLAYFQPEEPIYSSKMVRFHFGYSRSSRPRWSGLFECLCDMPQRVDIDEFIWTYVSPAFPMAQEDTMQTFELPKPTLCIGGVFQIEFMGRVQTQQSDNLYYICVSHVHITGRPLSDFKFGGIEKGQFVLKHLDKRDEDLLMHSSSCLEQKDTMMSGAYLIEQIRANRLALRNRSVLDILLRNLLAQGLLDPDENEDLEDE